MFVVPAVNGRPSQPEPAAPPLRRAPVQRRSRERVDRILLAADELLDEVGHDALSTRAVAERAGVPVATLYQFFADKHALIRAVASNHLERFGAIVPGLATGEWDDWRDGLRAALEGFAGFAATSRGFRDLWWGGHLDPSTVAAEQATNELLARQLEAFIASDGRAVTELPDRPRLAYVIAIAVADRLLHLAHRSAPTERGEIVDEALRLMIDTIERDLVATTGDASVTRR